jgi:ArsR family transcriptional regulator
MPNSGHSGFLENVAPAANLQTAEDMAELMRTLSHPDRIEMLRILEFGDSTVGNIAAALDLPHNTASRHLARLQTAGLVASRNEGTFRIYTFKRTPLTKLLLPLMNDVRS